MAIPPAPGSEFTEEIALLKLESAVQSLGVDLLGIQEIDLNQPRSFHIHHVQEIASAMKTDHWAFAPAIIGTPGEKWRALADGDIDIVTRDHPSVVERGYGIGLISKIPVSKWHRLDLGKSWIGMPLAVPRKKGVGIGYVADEPRVALVAELENGFTVAVTHLSFVPFVNYFQLKKLQRFMSALPGVPLIMGDLNLPWNLPEKSGWKSLISKLTYPSWGAKIQFDYLLMEESSSQQFDVNALDIPVLGLSDHLPIGVEIIRKL